MTKQLGCPVANGLPGCGRNCGGGWAGTHITHAAMLKALEAGRLDADKLVCGELMRQVREWKFEAALMVAVKKVREISEASERTVETDNVTQ